MRRYELQDPGAVDKPEIKRPPDTDISELDDTDPDQPTRPGAPPFTGEDVEDIPRPDLPVM
jgi:hypothetical protein